MWYGLVRFALCYGLVWLPLFILLNKTIHKKFGVIILGFILAFILILPYMASHTYPVENLFISFKSPQQVVNYYKSGNILDVVQGERSCLIIYEGNRREVNNSRMREGDFSYISYRDWYSHMFIHKTSKGYKLPDERSKFQYRFERVVYEPDKGEDGMLTIYRAVDTDDYYSYRITELVDNKFEIIYGYGISIDDLKNNLKRISVTLELGELPTWEFVE